MIDLSFHERWEYRGCTRSPSRLAEFRSIFGNKRMIFIVSDDGSISFYTERPGRVELKSALPDGFKEVLLS